MSTFIIVYGLFILLGMCFVGGGVILLVKNLPDKFKNTAKFRNSTSRRQSRGKNANEQVQEMLRDFEEKWRNHQK